MAMLDFPITFVLSVFDGICVTLLLNAYLRKRAFFETRWGNVAVSLSIALVWTAIILLVTSYVPRSYQGFQSIAILISGFLLAVAFYRTPTKMSLLPMALVFIAQHVLLMLTELVEGIVYCWVQNIPLAEAQGDPAAFLAAGIVSRIVLFFMIIAFLRRHRLGRGMFSEKGINRIWLTLLCPAGVTVVAVYALLFAYHDTNETGRILIIVAAMSLMFLKLVILYIFNEVIANENELSLAGMQVQQIEYQLQAVSAIARISQEHETLLHDEKNKLVIVLDLLQTGNISEGVSALRSIAGEISGVVREAYTAYLKTDIMLSVKHAAAAEQNIQMTISAKPFGPGKLPLRDEDLAVIMGNILDNAIEAVVQLPKDRVIKVGMEECGEDYLITVINNTASDIEIVDNIIPTTKVAGGLHGVGLRSVGRLLHRYQGEYFLQSDSGWFQFTARIPFQQRG